MSRKCDKKRETERGDKTQMTKVEGYEEEPRVDDKNRGRKGIW